MKSVISDEFPTDTNIIHVPKHMQAGLQQTTPAEWDVLFRQFRFNLQNRIPGCNDRDLIKVQGNMEYLTDLAKFFKEVVSKPAG